MGRKCLVKEVLRRVIEREGRLSRLRNLCSHFQPLSLPLKPKVADEQLREQLREIISNSKLSEHFLALARDLDVMEAKTPEDVYKVHLCGMEGGRKELGKSSLGAVENCLRRRVGVL